MAKDLENKSHGYVNVCKWISIPLISVAVNDTAEEIFKLFKINRESPESWAVRMILDKLTSKLFDVIKSEVLSNENKEVSKIKESETTTSIEVGNLRIIIKGQD